MKRLFLLFALVLTCCVDTLRAQAPREMVYQLMVIDPDNGRIRADKDVAVRMEIRRGSETNVAVWAQEFAVHTDKAGICTMKLALSDEIDWADGEYYLAAIIDGREGGATKITSVPYALHAAEAEHAVTADSLTGTLSREELVGTWTGTTTDHGRVCHETYVFNEDGTGTYAEHYEGSSYEDYYTGQIEWQWFQTLLYIKGHVGRYGYIDDYEVLGPIVKFDNRNIRLAHGIFFDAILLTKQ